jgi:hypothetical protein
LLQNSSGTIDLPDLVFAIIFLEHLIPLHYLSSALTLATDLIAVVYLKVSSRLTFFSSSHFVIDVSFIQTDKGGSCSADLALLMSTALLMSEKSLLDQHTQNGSDFLCKPLTASCLNVPRP